MLVRWCSLRVPVVICWGLIWLLEAIGVHIVFQCENLVPQLFIISSKHLILFTHLLHLLQLLVLHLIELLELSLVLFVLSDTLLAHLLYEYFLLFYDCLKRGYLLLELPDFHRFFFISVLALIREICGLVDLDHVGGLFETALVARVGHAPVLGLRVLLIALLFACTGILVVFVVPELVIVADGRLGVIHLLEVFLQGVGYVVVLWIDHLKIDVAPSLGIEYHWFIQISRLHCGHLRDLVALIHGCVIEDGVFDSVCCLTNRERKAAAYCNFEHLLLLNSL